MGIQPIDLQIMYSQISNVSKIASQQQKGAELTNAMQHTREIQQASEQVSAVQKAASQESKTSVIKDEGKSSQQNLSGNFRKKQESEENSEKRKEVEIRESYLGQHIDITR